jgi:hypothetical protein
MPANNQGIAHLMLGGTRGMFRVTACRRADAHIGVAPERFDAEPRKCRRCEAKWIKMKAVQQRRAERTLDQQIAAAPGSTEEMLANRRAFLGLPRT